MKPFNLEAAKAGWPLCTRDGRKARLLCTDRYAKDVILPVVALVPEHSGYEEQPRLFGLDGRFLLTDTETGNDLMMADKEYVLWVTVFTDIKGHTWTSSWNTEDDALF